MIGTQPKVIEGILEKVLENENAKSIMWVRDKRLMSFTGS